MWPPASSGTVAVAAEAEEVLAEHPAPAPTAAAPTSCSCRSPRTDMSCKGAIAAADDAQVGRGRRVGSEARGWCKGVGRPRMCSSANGPRCGMCGSRLQLTACHDINIRRLEQVARDAKKASGKMKSRGQLSHTVATGTSSPAATGRWMLLASLRNHDEVGTCSEGTRASRKELPRMGGL